MFKKIFFFGLFYLAFKIFEITENIFIITYLIFDEQISKNARAFPFIKAKNYEPGE